MPTYGQGQLLAAFQAVDAQLTGSASVTLIGGSVAVLLWLAESATKDIDVLYGADSADFVTASDRARQWLHAELPPVQVVSIASLPDGYEERRSEYPLGLARLHLFVPEAHDWAMAKIARGNQEDIEAVAEVNAKHPLDTNTLVDRYLNTDVVGRRSAFRTSFLATLGWWLPEEALERIESRLASLRAGGKHWRERND